MVTGIRAWIPEFRHLPPANSVGSSDDLAVRRLPEHLGQAHHRRHSALDQIPKHRPRPHGRKLVYVADQNERHAVAYGTKEGVHQRHVHHRGFVNDQEIAFQGIRFVPAEAAGSRVDFQQAVNRLGFQPSGFRQPLRRPAGGRTQEALHALGWARRGSAVRT